MRNRVTEIGSYRDAIGVSAEQVAARVRVSKGTYLRAEKGLTPPETTKALLEALEEFRREKLEMLSALKIKAG